MSFQRGKKTDRTVFKIFNVNFDYFFYSFI